MKCKKCGAEMEFRQMSGVCVCPECGQVAEADEAARGVADAAVTARTALQFYANEENYQGEMLVLADGGQLAREALASMG